MIFFLVFLIFIQDSVCSGAGSSIFFKRSSRRNCWTNFDIAGLRARQLFEELIPPVLPPDKMNDRYIQDLLGYFKGALQTAAKNHDTSIGLSPAELLADTIGSHLRSDMLPSARLAYYAGNISYRKARDLHDFYNNIKIMLNTQGLGWKLPARLKKWGNLTMEKIRIGLGKNPNPCALLIFKRDTSSCIYLPTPKLDDSDKPSAIALPLKTEGLVSLESPKSENVLLNYYTTASGCILRNSSTKCRQSDFVGFNSDLWRWMKRDVAPHLTDEKLYAAFGGVLRVAAAVQSYGRGLSRRNIISYRDESKWRPWKTVPDDSVDDTTLYLCMIIVLSVSTIICLLQVIYSNILNENGICRYKHPQRNMDVEYAKADSSIPVMLPRHRDPVTPRNESGNTTRTRKVYDLHENREEDMAIEESSEDSESSTESEIIKELENKSAQPKNAHSLSPPRIETSMSEVRIQKKRPITSRKSYSTNSFIADSAQTFIGGKSSCTESESSLSEESFSTSSKISKRSRNKRDLAWARRIVSKQNILRTSDSKSFTPS
ncbi:uncharacterized protein LOC121729748 [Aricia agestis]|uniref:uncharacterized protein LOC121729748 n=1 Tax=Aricia agestis TaxID=91739 RepID=UPI001C201C99|nr:uncharacterized protein LOC121729748 [Aricia agestis]